MALSLTFRIALAAALIAASSPAATPVSYAGAHRFLTQASWGPTPITIQQVQYYGMSAYIDQQLTVQPSDISDSPIDPKSGRASVTPVQQQFFYNAVEGNDQLRQRVAFALHQMWVISANKINDPAGVVDYLRVLQHDAFANYRQLMYDVTLTPGMGHYLDMVNNDKPNPALGKEANENYAREILQLFTIGLNQLNADGSLKTDSMGHAIPTYTQDTVSGFARLFTGWTYAPAPNNPFLSHNPAYWSAPMVPVAANHDVDPKLLLNGFLLPANKTPNAATADLNAGLDNIFHHANVPPFVCKQLIQHLVTSNPSPAYVKRVADVFANNGQSVRGDLAAVVKAILLDPEARAGDDGPTAANEGHLREPVLLVNGLLRELGAAVAFTSNYHNYAATLGQTIYYPASVFSYFSPNFRIAGANINAPEFQLLDTSTAILRAGFVNTLVYGNIGLDLTPYSLMSADDMINSLDLSLTGGRSTPDMRAKIRTAVDAAPTLKTKAQAAAYLLASAWQYQVEQ